MESSTEAGNDTDQVHKVSELLCRLSTHCLKEAGFSHPGEDLRKLKLKSLAVLAEYQGLETPENNDTKRLELLSATLRLHQAGRSLEADRLLELSDTLTEVCRGDFSESANGVPALTDALDELPLQIHEPILHMLLLLQRTGNPEELCDRPASARSNSDSPSLDLFSHQLRSMHDHVGKTNRDKPGIAVYDSSNSSSRPDTQSSVSPGLDPMLSAMRRIPCWEASTSGRGMQACAPSKAALGTAGASLLFHMEALPDESHAAWRFSVHEPDTILAANGTSTGHTTIGKGMSTPQSGEGPKIEMGSREGDWPLAASWGHILPHKKQDTAHVVNEGILAYELLLALQGVVPAILRLGNGHFRTETLSEASLSNLLRPSIRSGVLRANLDAHLSRMAFQAMSGPAPDTCLQAFAAEAIQVLREQSSALQNVAESVRLRRKADLQNSIRRVTPGSLRHHLACVGVTAATEDDLTVLEVTVHTRALQAQLRALADVCGLDGQGDPLSGGALLDHLHERLEAADAVAAPLVQRLLPASYRPFAELLEDWLFHPGVRLPCGSAFCDRLPADLAGLLPSASPAQAVPCRVPAFLQRWQRQVLLAGLHLRVLHCMPAPLNRIASGLADIAAAERVPVGPSSSGAEELSGGMSTSAVPMPLTLHSTEMNKVVASQDAAIREREAFVSSQLAEAAAAAISSEEQPKGSCEPAALGRGPEGACNSKLAAHEPAFLGTMRVLTATGPSRLLQLCSVLPHASSPTSSNNSTSCSDSGTDRSEPGSKGNSPRASNHSLDARMGALPDLGAPQPSALEMASANGFPVGSRGPRLPKPWMLGRQNGALSHSRPDASGAASDWDSDEDDEETVPLEAAVEVCVVRRVLSQYACTGSACLRCLEHLGLGQALAALERYAFMGAGDWAAALVQLLCAASLSVEAPRPHDLHRMLDASVQASSAADDPYSAALSLRPGTTRSALLAQGRPSPLLSLQLGMDVRWPLSVVISQSAVAQYNEVFGVLLELHTMSFQLQRLWLESVHRHGMNARAWISTAMLQRVKELRNFRTAAAQVLDAVQGYMYAQLHSASFPALMQDIEGSKDLVEARKAMGRYLTRALRACLLTADMRHSAQLLAPVLRAISDCVSAMLPALRSTDGDLVEAVMSERLWQRMHAPMCAFDAHMRTLVTESKSSGIQEVVECVLAHVVLNDHWLQ